MSNSSHSYAAIWWRRYSRGTYKGPMQGTAVDPATRQPESGEKATAKRSTGVLPPLFQGTDGVHQEVNYTLYTGRERRREILERAAFAGVKTKLFAWMELSDGS
ncbi:uncharacterized protein MCYG_00824 [Microsporum canis CBS 113480]|uniref:Uncharacterized protein n=1 Tax=Arthroderma otae (strain ATCC MYA-4605 / CBS 113480) TaxID=554155 RepID=C5FDG2_ARTOC|nr:uncharacterized protein MCYG_00824 [Microsporum canis CBS 113480]EEQ27936.1 predicted protein [Microsporum canis CBS 113480]